MDWYTLIGFFPPEAPASLAQSELERRGFASRYFPVPDFGIPQSVLPFSDGVIAAGLLSGGVIGTVVGLGTAAGLIPALARNTVQVPLAAPILVLVVAAVLGDDCRGCCGSPCPSADTAE